MPPFPWPVNKNLRGLEPIRAAASHSCALNAVTRDPSILLQVIKLKNKKLEANRFAVEQNHKNQNHNRSTHAHLI